MLSGPEEQEATWLTLRRLRGRPPILVHEDAGELFGACIEQGEAYHAAARVAGAAVAPTLLYYSLLQLGTAALLAEGIHPQELPHLHGIGGPKKEMRTKADTRPEGTRRRYRNEAGRVIASTQPVGADEERDGYPVNARFTTRPVFRSRGAIWEHAVELRDPKNSKNHFQRMQLLIGEERKKTSTTIAALLAGHPELADLFPDLRESRPVRVRAVSGDRLHTLRGQLTGLVLEVEYGPQELNPDELVERLRVYGLPEGWTVTPEGGGVRAGDRSFIAHINWAANPDRSTPGILDYSGSTMNVSNIDHCAPAGLALDPHDRMTISPPSPTGARWSRLSWWWALLHGLSDAARYSPGEWAHAVSLSSSTGADFHELFDRAVIAVPQLGVWAIAMGERAGKPPPVEHTQWVRPSTTIR